MQGAILNGLFNLNSPVDITCPGNCYWEEFTTLAVTPLCENVTAASDRQCAFKETSTICNYTTPTGLNFTGKRFFNGGSEDGGTPFASAAHSVESVELILNPGDKPPGSTMLRIVIATMDEPYDVDRPYIVECQLDLVARTTRNLTVLNGTFNPGISEDMKLNPVIIGTLRGTGSTFVNGTGHLYPLYIYQIADEHLSSYKGESTFNITDQDYYNIQTFLADIFNNDNRVKTPISQIMYPPLYMSSDRVETIRAMARGITYEFGRASGSKLEGKVIESELYIKVNWLWIILPLAEVVMGIAFMACTLIYNHRMGVAAWKSSNIVPLLTTMVGWENEQLGAASLRTLEERSRRMKGRLVPNQGSVQELYRTE